MPDKMILTTSPSITKKEIDYVTDAITNGHGEHWGDYIKRFEKQFAEYLGVRHTMATSSCTGALHLALVALGIGEGDEVIVPDSSWIATASVVKYVGAKPVFADVHRDTWCLNIESATQLVTHKTKAIIPVHLYGTPCNMREVRDFAKRYVLKVVEDAAPSLGAEFNNNKTGTLGDVAGFSFQGAKMLSTGEGGMVVTNDSGLFDRIKHFAEHGRSGSGFHISDIGYKYKMSNLQAAWGCAQLERVHELIAKKKLIYEWYNTEIGGKDMVMLNKRKHIEYYSDQYGHAGDTIDPVFWMTSIVLGEECEVPRDVVISKLKEAGIDSRPFFPPMSSFRMFEKHNNPVAEYIGSHGINLPSGHDLTQKDVEYICRVLKNILPL